jgi:hypothetical protein
MSKPLQPLTIAAPGFLGVNTEESAIGMNPAYAQRADNCIVDKQGRVASRKGYDAVSTNGSSVLGSSEGIEAIFEFTSFAGVTTVFSAGNNKIFTGTTTLSEVTLPGGYTISANNWKIISFNNNVYFYQKDHAPLKSAAGSTTLTEVGGSSVEANEVISAFGRVWAADVTGDKHTISVSKLLNGDDFSTGDSFSIDVTQYWPEGYDEIVALTEHNGLFIVFGRHSMLIYDGASGGAGTTSSASSARDTIFLADTIEGVGCIERDSIQATGDDILFLSERGVMSLGRVIQEKSLPLRDVSKNVRTDLMASVNGASNPVKSVYSPDDAFYLLTIQDSNLIFCFDVRTPLQDGSFRVTTWSGIEPKAYANKAAGGFYMGLSSGLVEYAGFLDGTSSYEMEYFSNPLDFGSPGVIKMLKKVNLLVEGGADAQCVLKWSYDYSENYKTQNFKFDSYNSGEFNVSEYNTTAEYAGGVNLNTKKTNATGSGTVVSFGVTATIDDTSFAIQKIDLLTMTGRLL